MNKHVISLLIATALTAPAFAQGAPSEGRDLAEAQFNQTDANSDGMVSLQEYAAQGENIFISMDADESGDVTEDEFIAWGYGNAEAAEQLGTSEAFAAARRANFDSIDTNFDWKVSAGEMGLFSAKDFVQCDVNRDGMLDLDEYLFNSSLNVAYRAALMPAENRMPAK